MSNEAHLTDEQIREATRIFGELSPENLTCDGELSAKQVNARYRQLITRLRKLESITGQLDEMAVYNEYSRRGLRTSPFML